MSELSPQAWELLHDVRLRGMVPGPDNDETRALVDAGYAARRNTNTVITQQGKSAHAEWARVSAGSEEETVARVAYERFLEIDLDIKKVTTDWQMLNAPGSSGFGTEEWNLIDRLTGLDQRFGPQLRALGSAVPRFSGYRQRLKHALEKLEDGERQWFSGLTCDSYHTVWWQLHEDLMSALGIDRSDDPNQ